MKILYLVSFFPFPPHSGGALRVSNIIQQLAPRRALLDKGQAKLDLIQRLCPTKRYRS